jgi:type IV pilus assembly protein PilF
MYRTSSTLLLVVMLTACTMVPVGPSKDEKASKINVQLGVGYYQQGNLEQANEKLLKALRQDPESSQAHYAYAVLQHRFLHKEKAEEHFRKAIELDPQNSEALSNFGAFLCNQDRIDESIQMFMQAVENPLYKSPEVAYTNAAVCLLKKDDTSREQATEYLHKALAARSNYRLALINIAELMFEQNNFEMTRLYLKRFNVAGEQTARSLWLEIRNELSLDNSARAYGLAEKLKADFPQSNQYKSWLELSK